MARMLNKLLWFVPVVMALAGFTALLLFHYENQIFHSIESHPGWDSSSYQTCEHVDKTQNRVFYYAFIGCQLKYDIAKALHPYARLVGDDLNHGDYDVPGQYTYNNLALKAKSLVTRMCEERMYEQYDMFVKIDEDAFVDTTVFRYTDADVAAVWRDNEMFTGMVYAYSSNVLRSICNMSSIDLDIKKHEDLYMTRLINAVPEDIAKCSLRNTRVLHKFFNNERLRFYFRPYLEC